MMSSVAIRFHAVPSSLPQSQDCMRHQYGVRIATSFGQTDFCLATGREKLSCHMVRAATCALAVILQTWKWQLFSP
jgi:hypothetical protein